MSDGVNHLIGLKAQAQREGWAKWIRSEADERALLNGCRFRTELGEHVVEFFEEYLKLSVGEWAGEPFTLQEWQRDDIAMPLFGWVNAEGLRRFRKAYIEVPKKNGKSEFASGIGLYMLVADNEPGAEVYSAGFTRPQAGIVHGGAVNMVDASKELQSVLKVNRSTFEIKFPAMRSFYRAISGEAESAEGLKIHALICDEMHAWKGTAFWNSLRYGFASRRQPLIFIITTAGSNMYGVGRKQHDAAKAILEGRNHDDTAFAYIRAADNSDDWRTDESVWFKANPSLGVTVKLDEFRQAVNEAANDPSIEPSFKRYRLNIWTVSEQPWISSERWDACERDYTEDDLEGREGFAALDLGIVDDTTAFVVAFPPTTTVQQVPTVGSCDDGVRLLAWFWLGREIAKKRGDKIPYLDWSRDGFIELTPGDWVDQQSVVDGIVEAAKRFKIKKLAYDPTRADLLIQAVMAKCPDIEMVPWDQGYKTFAAPTEEFESLVKREFLHHNGHPVLTHHVQNAIVTPNQQGHSKPIKPDKDSPLKVDGAQAAVMAIGAMLMPAEVVQPYQAGSMWD